MSDPSDAVVLAAGYFPIGLWLTETTCLVYAEESPDPAAVDSLKDVLRGRGMAEIEVGDDLRAAVLSLTMSRVQDIGSVWATWSLDEPTARTAITQAVANEL